MGIYTRFKKSPDGMRQLVTLLETTPMSRRQKMIDAGMAEDPAYTEKALSYVYSFEDILKLPDMELAEMISQAPPRTVAYAIRKADDLSKVRFIKMAKPQAAAEIRDLIHAEVPLSAIGGAQLKLIEIARKLEKQGLIKTKRIPTG